MRFGKKRKISPQFVDPYQILRHVGKIVYMLDLPNELAQWIRFSMSLF